MIMRNYILKNRQTLAAANYIRKADPKHNYWLDFARGVIEGYRRRFGDQFNVIIVGDAEIEDDFYVVPFRALAPILREGYLADDAQGPRRWIGSIKLNRLHINNCPEELNIGAFYGNIASLGGTGESTGLTPVY
jgi:putative restriction endonuclease